MIYSKPHATLKEQVQRLRERGLIIDDEQRAEHFLSIAGYYRISSYCYRFEFPPVDGKRTHQFKEGTRFDDIIRVYVFDQKLRTLRKLFKTPLQFRLARTSSCHTGQIAVTILLKGTFEELP